MDLASTDPEGFLLDISSWTVDYGKRVAGEHGIELTYQHLAVIDAARAFYTRTGKSPSMRPLVNVVRRTCGTDLGSSLALAMLFPNQTSRLVALIGGLPKPSDCL